MELLEESLMQVFMMAKFKNIDQKLRCYLFSEIFLFIEIYLFSVHRVLPTWHKF